MRKTIVVVLLLSLLLAGCGKDKTTTHKLAIYCANADATLLAFTEATARLNDAGRLNATSAKSIYQINLKIAASIDILRDRSESGFSRKDALVIISSLIDDLRRAEAEGVISLAGKEREQFVKITFFCLFALNSIEAVIAAVKEPTIPADEVRSATLARKGLRYADESVWTDLVLILQSAVIRGLSQSRMNQQEAIVDGRVLSEQVKNLIRSKLTD